VGKIRPRAAHPIYSCPGSFSLGVRRVSVPAGGDRAGAPARWHLRFGLSVRDVDELLAERGVEVEHVTVHRGVRRFAPLLADAARFGRPGVGDRWHVDETYVKVAGRWVYLYRAVDQCGQVIDVYASTRRDSEAARRFFQRAKSITGVTPSEVITDRAPTYPRVLDLVVPAAWHHLER
jgi:transposase-like protein